MAFGNAELDKLKGVERAQHALNNSDLDRPSRYHHDHEMSKSAFEKEKQMPAETFSWKKFGVKVLEIAVLILTAGVLLRFFWWIFLDR